MSNVLQPFPDVEEYLRNALLDRFAAEPPEGNIIADVVGNLASEMPDNTVFLERIGGARTRLNDYPLVDIEVFRSGRSRAKALIESIDAFLLGYPHRVSVGTGTVIIDFVLCTRTPVRLPWDDSNISRFGATYSLSVRR